MTANVTPGFSQTRTLPGSFGVSASGAATYNIPIAVPPGTAGVSPSLSIEYSSQAGDGIVGFGWSLGGLVSIGRCPQTMAQDGVLGSVKYDGNDRFCLDGQRLVAISGAYGGDGTEYRTEVDSSTKVVSHGAVGGGPSWFEVRTKAGHVMQLGGSADSQILAQGKAVVRSWALNKLSDTKGNYFTVTYTNDAANGQAYPIEVDYTGNSSAGLVPYNKIQFVYEARPDVAPQYQAGSLIRTAVRLTDIRTFAGASLVGDYKLSYSLSGATRRSLLGSIQLCGGDGSCLPTSTVSWTSGGNGAFAAVSQLVNGFLGFPPNANWTPVVGDFNGDGKTDFAFVIASSIWTFMSNGDGTFASGG